MRGQGLRPPVEYEGRLPLPALCGRHGRRQRSSDRSRPLRQHEASGNRGDPLCGDSAELLRQYPLCALPGRGCAEQGFQLRREVLARGGKSGRGRPLLLDAEDQKTRFSCYVGHGFRCVQERAEARICPVLVRTREIRVRGSRF
ncbi:hypothetical protein D1872_229440 [compost metagenome]